MAAVGFTHVDVGDVVCLDHHEPAHVIVSTSTPCGCGHHLAEDATGWSVVLGEDDSLPCWCVVKAAA